MRNPRIQSVRCARRLTDKDSSEWGSHFSNPERAKLAQHELVKRTLIRRGLSQ